MNKLYFLMRRNVREILRDPLSFLFGLLFPIVLLLLLTLINRNIPGQAQMDLFELRKLAPGAAVFGLSFLALFVALLVAKDRESSLLMRLYIAPLKASHFIVAYLLPLVPMAIVQLILCYFVSIPLGLEFTPQIFIACIVSLPVAVVYIAIGMISGTLFKEKAVGAVCGALLTNLSAWLSGTWFSLDLIGGTFRKIAYILPFANAVDSARFALIGDYAAMWEHLWIVILWAASLLLMAIILFAKKKKAK